MHANCFSRIQPFVTRWAVANQAPLSMGFPRHEYWSGLSCPPPGDPPNPGIKPTPTPVSCIAGEFFTAEPLEMPSVVLILGKIWTQAYTWGILCLEEESPNLCLHLHLVSPICMPVSLYKAKYGYRHAWSAPYEDEGRDHFYC